MAWKGSTLYTPWCACSFRYHPKQAIPGNCQEFGARRLSAVQSCDNWMSFSPSPAPRCCFSSHLACPPCPRNRWHPPPLSTSPMVHLSLSCREKKATGIFINKPGHFPACLMSLREKGAAVFTLLGLFCNKNLARICRKSCGGGSDRYFRQSLVKLAAEFCV